MRRPVWAHARSSAWKNGTLLSESVTAGVFAAAHLDRVCPLCTARARRRPPTGGSLRRLERHERRLLRAGRLAARAPNPVEDLVDPHLALERPGVPGREQRRARFLAELAERAVACSRVAKSSESSCSIRPDDVCRARRRGGILRRGPPAAATRIAQASTLPAVHGIDASVPRPRNVAVARLETGSKDADHTQTKMQAFRPETGDG